MKKFCAFGWRYLDSIGEVVEESKNYYIVRPENSYVFYKAIPKNDQFIKVFDSREECSQWIAFQSYEYDRR